MLEGFSGRGVLITMNSMSGILLLLPVEQIDGATARR
jgi:hypothetical protein